MTFKSTKVEKTGDTTAKVTGDLTIMGVTQPAVLDVKLNKDRHGPQQPEEVWAGLPSPARSAARPCGSAGAAGVIGDAVAIRIETLAVAQ
ncbi:YceI family protein [Caulobacter segnis]